MVYLVDTSVWIRHFSSHDPLDLRDSCAPDERVICLPIYQELLQGIREESHYRSLRTILGAARFVENPLRQPVFDHAVVLYRLARKQGLTIRSSVDCLIAACAIRNNLVVLHSDRDFSDLSRVSSLREESL